MLEQTLSEEKAANDKLTQIAESIVNAEAQRGEPAYEMSHNGFSPRGKRRVVIDQGGQRPGGPPGRQGRGRQDVGPPKQPREVVAPTGPVTVESGVTVRDYSQVLGTPMGQILKMLMDLKFTYNEDFDGYTFTKFDGTRITV